MLESDGFSFGAGKSTLALKIAKKIYKQYTSFGEFKSEELVKENMGYTWSHLKEMIVRGFEKRVLCYVQDDFQLIAGKELSRDNNVKWMKAQMTTKRPYCAVFICTTPELGELAKCMRDLMDFEIKIPQRGSYEVQRIKTKTDYRDPLNPYKKLDYFGDADFDKLSPELQKWYDDWRNVHNIESFLEGFEKRFGEKQETERPAISQRLFVETARELKIKGETDKLRDLYKEMVLPLVKR